MRKQESPATNDNNVNVAMMMTKKKGKDNSKNGSFGLSDKIKSRNGEFLNFSKQKNAFLSHAPTHAAELLPPYFYMYTYSMSKCIS
jgi:hypothetical protein